VIANASCRKESDKEKMNTDKYGRQQVRKESTDAVSIYPTVTIGCSDPSCHGSQQQMNFSNTRRWRLGLPGPDVPKFPHRSSNYTK